MIFQIPNNPGNWRIRRNLRAAALVELTQWNDVFFKDDLICQNL